MIKEMLLVKERINGPEAKCFNEKYYGNCFSGNFLLQYEEESCTYCISQGQIVSAAPRALLDGCDAGVKGTAQAWKDFVEKEKKSLSYATSFPVGEALTLIGKPVRVRQCFGALACVCRVFGDIIEEGEKVSG